VRAPLLFLVLVLALGSLGIACTKPAPPTITPEKATVTRIDLTGVALDLSMSATNPNSVDLTATGVSTHVVVNKTHDVGTVTLPKTITLPAGKSTKLDVPVTLTWSDMGLLAELAASKGAVPYAVDGTMSRMRSTPFVAAPPACSKRYAIGFAS
jgi:LEA14-like dessication related protein